VYWSASRQYPLLLYAIGIPISIVLALWFTEPTAPSRETASAADRADRGTYVRELTAVLLRPRVVASVLVFRMIPILLYITFMTYVSLLVVRSMGGTAGQAGILVALASATYAVAATQAGRFGSSFAGRIFPLATAISLMAVGLVIVARSSRRSPWRPSARWHSGSGSACRYLSSEASRPALHPRNSGVAS